MKNQIGKTLMILFLLIPFFLVQPIAAQDSTFRGEKIRFQSDILEFVSQDSIQPPPKQSILFIGSSIFRRWTTLREDMAPLPVFNRAFGGSKTHEVLYYMDKIVLPYEPKIVVYYCGSNDAGSSVPAEKVVKNIKDFFEQVERSLPNIKIFFISVNRSPARITKWPCIDSINTILQKYCTQSGNRKYIDVNIALFDSTGNPRYDLYLADKLHFKEDSYKEFTRIIKPILMEAWSEINKI